jgi:hypothetical protein
MAEPTDEQLREYAAKLPEIYRDVLAAFPKADPARRQGDAVQVERLLQALPGTQFDTDRPTLRDVSEAISNLRFEELVEDTGFEGVYPTELGERLVAAITGRMAPVRVVPPLPVPTW